MEKRFGALSGIATFSLLTLAAAQPARATTFTINTTNMGFVTDSQCGLAEAIQAVNTLTAGYGCPAGTGNDTIQLQAATYVPLGTLRINRGVTIKGTTPDPALGLSTQITGENTSTGGGALFYVADINGAMSVTFQYLNLNGLIASGNQVSGIWAVGTGSVSTVHVLGSYVYGFTYSGIYANSFNVDVQDSYVAANSTPTSGGGIYVADGSKNLTVARSTFDVNSATGYGGAIEYQGIGTSSVVASTIFQNAAQVDGGGIDIEGKAGSFAIKQSTIVYNSCEGFSTCGGGVLSMSGDYIVNFSMDSTIVADNTGYASSSDWFSDGNITVTNSDILNNVGSYFDGGGNSHMGQDPQTPEELTRLGGLNRLPVCLLPSASPVLDVLSTLSPGVDERGFTRGVSKTTGLTGSTLFDMGAYEYNPNTESETMTAVRNSGTLSTTTGSNYSAGKVLKLQGSKAGDYVTFYLPSLTIDGIGNYNFVARFATGPSEGIVQLEYSTDKTFSTGVVTIGSTVDLYASTSGVLLKNYNVSKALDSDNVYYIRLRVTGKNGASTGYAVVSDYINAVLL